MTQQQRHKIYKKALKEFLSMSKYCRKRGSLSFNGGWYQVVCPGLCHTFLGITELISIHDIQQLPEMELLRPTFNSAGVYWLNRDQKGYEVRLNILLLMIEMTK